MTAYIGNGWRIVHLTDRCVHLRKESFEYRMMLDGEDGFVHVDAEPGMNRQGLIEKALVMAQRSDARLAEFIALQHAPQTARYKQRQAQLSHAFRTPEDPTIIGVKRP